jgi:hypothetical protein
MRFRVCRSILRRAFTSALLLYVVTLPRTSAAVIHQVIITGTVDFVGCPSAISCPSFPLMWGISGDEAMTAWLIYDDESPLAWLDDQSPSFVSARYDHSLPLPAPLGIEVHFGPYSAVAGSSGAPASRYAIHLSDDLNSTCCPDLSESVGLEMTVPPLSFSLSAPSGFHDLDLRVVRLDFLNFSGIDDLLNGSLLPPNFPGLAWEEVRLTVDVFDPIDARDGRAFLTVETMQISQVPAIPTLSAWGMIALVASLIAVAGISSFRLPLEFREATRR